jgi:hypothetical protein
MAIDPKLVDQLLADYKNPEQIIGENGLLKQLTKALLERAMNAELTEHLGYGKHDPAGYNSGNSRNGTTKKKLKGDFGEIDLETPRDREGTFEPKIVSKGQTRFTGFDDKILSMYARGMSTREIQGHLEEIYGVEVSPALVSSVTEAVSEAVLQLRWDRLVGLSDEESPASTVPEPSVRAGDHRHLCQMVFAISAERTRRRGPDRRAWAVRGPHDGLAVDAEVWPGTESEIDRACEAEILHVAHG